ncbi:hypothetical protein VOLCADRAFT_91878 [Volvox carteri f. nagariensis]|uniref:Uncharacterized protein n=1 Tax=Volvox carteri f. nagariensis TaxID=3068 RepID=D8TY70_VOLCA|nr:uncharacterized protein VOLCADRAFT_91878 [Volvox carteri f. nagariensis]EFJ47593.1 hypothetical protein VOLCADRAFT_91878 [Volvox carteri f. nagariensis]|eukprot:XP_002951417.1 hypothetical protein VOLCADRAFT_91878 [Volvox carteri f. nagariensis]
MSTNLQPPPPEGYALWIYCLLLFNNIIGRSTALLRELAIPGVGYVNGSWPDAPSLATASNAASASAAAGTEDQTNDTLSTPLCATVRVVLLPPPPSPPPLLPPATSDAADAVASLTTGPTLQAVAACDISSAARNLTCSSSRSSNNNNNIGNSSSNNNSKNTTTKTAYQLEVNFQACDEGPTGQGGGNDGAVAHAFVCRVPAPARPSPAPSPSPSPSPPQSAPPPPPPTAKSLTRPASEHPPEHPPPQLPLPGLSNINPKTHTTETAPSEPPLPPLGPGPENTSSSPPARARRRTILAASWGPRGSSHTAGSRRRALSILTGSLGVTTVTLDGTSVTPPPVPLRSEGFPRPAFPPPSPLPPSPSPPLPPPPRGPSPPSPPWGTAESAINTSTALSAELVRPKCDSEVLTVGGVTLRYLACHTAASWAVSAELCADLAPRGTLAAFESQAQLDAVSRAFGAKDLGGMYDFWFGLASGVVSPPEQQPASPSPEGGKPPLEYVLTDPRVVPDFPARLWASGALGVDSTCRAEPDPPEPPGSPPAAPSPGVPLDVAFVQAESPPSASDTAPPRPSSPQSPNLKPTTPIALALPRPSGCCASLTILPAAADPAIAANTTTVTVPGAAAAAAAAGYSTPAPPGDAGPLLLLRACHHKIKFVCQVPVEATGIEVSPGPLGSATGGGATTLIASLFLDAVEPSYKGAYRVFRAQVELRLVGASYSRFSGDGGGALLEDFRNETERQLALATRLPVWSFEVLGLRSGSVVAEVNLTARGLPRATLANFSEFVTASLAVRRPQELFSNDFIQTWTIQVDRVRDEKHEHQANIA